MTDKEEKNKTNDFHFENLQLNNFLSKDIKIMEDYIFILNGSYGSGKTTFLKNKFPTGLLHEI